ncbi:MAG TPA: redoxin domain-containing protein [Alphaproteobacteria bacterium]|nr:redoxin domain-containing protein [Alphaproteobacteria bacterium]
MKASAAAVVCLLLAPPAAHAHALVDVQSDLSQREPAVAFEPGIGSPFPAFSLQDPDGQTIDLASLRGKVVVLDVVSTRTAAGSAQSDLMARIQDDVAAGHMADQVELISVALDAEHDTVAMRKSYGPAHGLKPENWVLLGGARDDDPQHLAVQLAAKPVPPGLAPPVTYIVDSAGMLRARFFGLGFDPLNLVVYVNALTNDHHETAAPSVSTPSLWQAVKGLL